MPFLCYWYRHFEGSFDRHLLFFSTWYFSQGENSFVYSFLLIMFIRFFFGWLLFIFFYYIMERKKPLLRWDYDTCKTGRLQMKSGSDRWTQCSFSGRWAHIVFFWLIFREGILFQCVFASLSMLQLLCRYIPTLDAILAHQSGTFMGRGSRSSDGEFFFTFYGITNTIGVYRVNGNIDCG